VPSWPLALGVFVGAYIIMYLGYLFDDRVRDSVVLIAQAFGIAVVAVSLARLLMHSEPRSFPQQANTRAGDHDDEREAPLLAPRVVKGAPPPHRLDLRWLTINLLEMMALAERYDRDLTLLMISVDDTDALTQDAGPKGLKRIFQEIGNILSETLRIPDRSGLYAENQYLVILPETDVKSGQQTAERIRRQVVDADIRIDARRTVSTTVSVGVAAFKPGDDPQGLLSRVQSALQEAQQLGKNRSVQWTA
jgi:diguanylate cyclase (GGDEF)-like protein